MSADPRPPSGDEAADGPKDEPPFDFAAHHDSDLHAVVNEQTATDVFWVLLTFRFFNSLCVRTFFQPDEYFQALEPAWQMAFGPESGAWITWEWQHRLRSSLHPAIFAAVYLAADKPMEYLECFPQFRALVLSALPGATQAVFAGIGDFYTWQLAEKLYGVGSTTAWTTLLLALFSPWEWFCSTRTFSSSLETTLTIAALYYWPWQLTVGDTPWLKAKARKSETASSAKTSESAFQTFKSANELRISLLLAITACILRPTNLLIWLTVVTPTLTRLLFSTSTSRVPFSDYLILLREGILCASVMLLISSASDRLYFGEWTFPPYQWLHFNLAQDLAVFYGRNDWHYYVSQGLPLLLTTYTPFALVALWRSTTAGGLRFLFATTVFTTLASLSLISHKEVRFVFPLLPLLHILTAPTISSFFYTATAATTRTRSGTLKTTTEVLMRHKLLLALVLLLNLSIGAYTTLIHQRGALSVTTFLRSEYERLALDPRGVPLSHPDANKFETAGWGRKNFKFDEEQVFAGFLMPCHSTPWRSRLFYPDMRTWALTCEPPLHLPAGSAAREAYRDEADRFYDDPKGFLEREMNTKGRPWPRYIVGFEGIEGWLREYYEGTMKGFKVREKWRTANSHWHDDSRRRGDVVVWEFVDGSEVEEQ